MTISPALGVIIMMNNFFHDLSVALFLCALLALMAILQERTGSLTALHEESLGRLEKLFKKTARWSFFFILAFGAVRTWFYKDFEWHSAVEHGQVAALIVKHVLFVLLIGAGWRYIWKLKNSTTGGARAIPSNNARTGVRV